MKCYIYPCLSGFTCHLIFKGSRDQFPVEIRRAGNKSILVTFLLLAFCLFQGKSYVNFLDEFLLYLRVSLPTIGPTFASACEYECSNLDSLSS